MSPVGLVPEYKIGDRVRTPDGPGEVIAFADYAYHPLDPAMENRRNVVRWIWGTQEVHGPFIVHLDVPPALRGDMDVAIRGYTWDQLKPA